LIVLPMSNCAPVLVVEGVEVDEVGEAVDGTVLFLFDPQPAIPSTTTTTADSVRTSARATGRNEPSVLCVCMLFTTPRD
jgi:hypothetical protein